MPTVTVAPTETLGALVAGMAGRCSEQEPKGLSRHGHWQYPARYRVRSPAASGAGQRWERHCGANVNKLLIIKLLISFDYAYCCCLGASVLQPASYPGPRHCCRCRSPAPVSG